MPLLLDLAASITLNLYRWKVLLESARTFNGSNKSFHCTCCKMEKVPLLQKWELFLLSPQTNCGGSTPVTCRQLGYPGKVTQFCVSSGMVPESGTTELSGQFCSSLGLLHRGNHIGCGQCNDTTCTCWHSSRLAFDHGQEVFSCIFLMIS